MILFSISFFLFGLLLCEGVPPLVRFLDSICFQRAEKRTKRSLQLAGMVLLDFEETLKSGHALNDQDFARLKSLDLEWSELIGRSIRTLRDRGASVIPTLERLRAQSVFQLKLAEDCAAKSAVGLMQARFCMFLTPALGAFLYSLLPELENRIELWAIAVLLAASFGGLGSFWMFQKVKSAQSGGVRDPNLLKEILLGLERWSALIRSGESADIAWTQASLGMQSRSQSAFQIWGSNVWSEDNEKFSEKSQLGKQIFESVRALKRSVVASVIEGKSVLERAESMIDALELEVRSVTHQSIEKLSVGLLKPLMLLIAPSILGLFGFAMFLSLPEG